jgi:large repetitive protein
VRARGYGTPDKGISTGLYESVLFYNLESAPVNCQVISFPPLGERTFGDPPFAVPASVCSVSGLRFQSSDEAVARWDEASGKLTVTGAGEADITALQPGPDPALPVTRPLKVCRKGQYIAFAPLPALAPGDALELDPPTPSGLPVYASASSGLALSFSSSDPAVAEVAGGTLLVKGAGTTVITARQPGYLSGRAGDNNYNPAQEASQPLRVAEDLTPPLLSLSTLSPGAVTANPVLNIMGAASDGSGIDRVVVNGAELPGATFFSSPVLLAAGRNSVEVSARDRAGNRTVRTLSVTLDAAAPQLSPGLPADNSVSEQPRFVAQGTLAPGAGVTVSVNGSPPQALAVVAGSFTGSGELQPGVNTVEFCAALSGRASCVKRSVTLAPGGPAAAILEPPQDIRTEQGSYTVRGTAGGTGARVALEVGGASYAPLVQAGGFQQTIALGSPGVFAITARVTDSAGRSSLAQRNLVRVPRVWGDLDGDGLVDIRDAQAALKVSLGMAPAGAAALAHGDVAPLVDGVPQPDGRIDAGDVLVILRKVVGLVDF